MTIRDNIFYVPSCVYSKNCFKPHSPSSRLVNQLFLTKAVEFNKYNFFTYFVYINLDKTIEIKMNK